MTKGDFHDGYLDCNGWIWAVDQHDQYGDYDREIVLEAVWQNGDALQQALRSSGSGADHERFECGKKFAEYHKYCQ